MVVPAMWFEFLAVSHPSQTNDRNSDNLANLIITVPTLVSW